MRHSLRKRPRLPATRYIPGEARFLRLLDRNTDIVSFALLGNFQQRTVATVLEQPVHQEIWRVGRSARVVPRWMSILGKVIPQTKSVGVCLKDVPNWRNGLFNSASLARILAQTRQVGKWVRMCIDGVQIEKRHQGHLTVSRLRCFEKRWTKIRNACTITIKPNLVTDQDTLVSRTLVWCLHAGFGGYGRYRARLLNARSFSVRVRVRTGVFRQEKKSHLGDAEMFKRILVPLDGSEIAEGVLPVVKAEAQCHGATVLLIRVIAPFRSSLMMVPSLLEQANAQAQTIVERYLKDVAERLRSEGLEVETRIERGPPAQRILDVAESDGCDLIIVGSHGETGAMRWRFGGVAFKIVKAKTAISVMIVTT